jgi:hypothetical protein
MSNIDFTMPVETVTGIPVQIISTSGREPYPVVGYVGEDSLALNEWTLGGFYLSSESESDYNLRNKATQPEEPWAAEKAAFAAGETIQYSSGYNPAWSDVFDPMWLPASTSHGPRYRIKPKPQKVPLEPCDVPPGSVFRAKEYASGRWKAPVEVSEHGVNFERRSTMTFQQLSESGWQIKRPTDTEWQPCCKEI